MNEKQELRFLKSIIKMQQTKKLPVYFNGWFNFVIWIFVGAVFLIGKRAYDSGEVNAIVILCVTLIIGMLLGFYLIYKESYRQWPYLKPYINTDKVKERVDELVG